MDRKENQSVEKYVLPSDYSELESFTKKYKLDMMEHVFNSIEHAVYKDLSIIEVFQFKNSEFVITLSNKDYQSNLDNIFSHFVKNENYEMCNKHRELQKTLTKKSENNTDEKEKR